MEGVQQGRRLREQEVSLSGQTFLPGGNSCYRETQLDSIRDHLHLDAYLLMFHNFPFPSLFIPRKKMQMPLLGFDLG